MYVASKSSCLLVIISPLTAFDNQTHDRLPHARSRNRAANKGGALAHNEATM